MIDELTDGYDVAVIGGGAAGLNGALMLARSRRSVVVVDSGAPRNSPAVGVHALLGHDGIPPSELIERGRAEVRRYGGQVITGEVTTAARDGDWFVLALADGRSARARRLLVASGLVDELPDMPGVRERWGRDVVHCPYCHGWEVRDQAIGVLSSGPMSVHQALLFRQLSSDVIYLTHGMPPNGEQAEQLAARGIRVVDRKVASLEVVEDRLVGVRLRDGTVIDRDALVVAPRMVARAGFLADLDCVPRSIPRGSERILALTRRAAPTYREYGQRATSPTWPPTSVPRRPRARSRRPRSTPTWSARRPKSRSSPIVACPRPRPQTIDQGDGPSAHEKPRLFGPHPLRLRPGRRRWR
jgi:thioredoxin reductase